MAPSPEEADDEPIDFDRVVIDSDYRRSVMRRLRGESPLFRTRAGQTPKTTPPHKD